MSTIVLEGINKYYGQHHILKELNLTIQDGDFMTLLGPSGCGKTTTLRVISGLEDPQSGTMFIDGKEIVNAKKGIFIPPAKRELDLVFQSYALWPHMTVFNNVSFNLKSKYKSHSELEKNVRIALERLQIGELADRYPSELSGGQQQRVAIARAIVSKTPILLLDEPLSNLDARLRIQMRSELKRLHKELGTTIIYVTHDQVEAMTMSTRIAVFFDGMLAQCDSPMEVYRNPANIRVADFIGNPNINMIEGRILDNAEGLKIESVLGKTFIQHISERTKSKDDLSSVLIGKTIIMAIRPEHVAISHEKTLTTDVLLKAKVYSVLPAGSETIVQINVSGHMLTVKYVGDQRMALDDEVYVGIDNSNINVYDKNSGKIIVMI